VELTSLFIDMNSYFASVEQQFDPSLRGRPVAVVPVESDATSCIAASAEAKRFGVRTGTNVGEARRKCPGLVCVKGNFELYVRTHHAILAAADTRFPVAGVHSIDEFSCRLMGDERRPERALEIARGIKRAIRERVGECLTCSVGIAPNRFLAKVASDMQKPDGLTMIRAGDLPEKLFALELIDLPGIGSRMEAKLRRAGIATVRELYERDENELWRAWGSVVGREWFLKLRGHEVREAESPRRTIGHSHVLSPDKRSDAGARGVGVRLATKTAARARHLGYAAGHVTLSVGYRLATQARGDRSMRWHEARAAVGDTNDTPTIVQAFAEMWASKPAGAATGRIVKIGITLTDLTASAEIVGPLFSAQTKMSDLSKAMDAINRKFGVDAVYSAAMHEARKSAPRRIAFGSIPDLDVPDVEN
jgi:DNA polymerase IV